MFRRVRFMQRGVRFGYAGVVVGAVFVASMIGIPSARATGGTELWVARSPGPGYSYVAGSAVSPDGSRLFVTGSVAEPTGDRFQTVAYDAAGAELWTRHYREGGPYNDGAAAIGVGPDGSVVFVTGKSSSATDLDYLTIAYDAATGTRVWKRRYSSPLSISLDVPAALGVSPDGSTVFVTGVSDGRPNGDDYLTVAYAVASGQQLWAARYNLSFQDSARTLSVSPDSSVVFVSGFSVATTSLDIETVAYDAATGEQLWQSRYDGPKSREDQANAMAVSPDGFQRRVEPRARHRDPGIQGVDRRAALGASVQRAERLQRQRQGDRGESRRIAHLRGWIPLGTSGARRRDHRVFIDGRATLAARLQRTGGQRRSGDRDRREPRRQAGLRGGIPIRSALGIHDTIT